jgi:protease IV
MPDAPVNPVPAPTPQRRWLLGCVLPLIFLALLASVLANVLLTLVYFRAIDDPLDTDRSELRERFYLGDSAAKDKVAIVRISGVISESGIQYPLRQLEAAARDPRVKAVVLRIDSPGGTVSASAELYANIINLRDDTGRRFKGTGPKPVSASLGAVAASGGYYVAVAGNPISAEPTTITGSIGVFAALPNVAELAHNNGVKIELVKAGEIKAAGSFFHDLSPEERQTWQDTVDTAYEQFLDVVAQNRPKLTPKGLGETVVIDRMIDVRDEKGNPKLDAAGNVLQVRYTRTLADGGTFTAAQAHEHGLIDKLDDLPATVRAAAVAAGLDTYKAVVYDRTPESPGASDRPAAAQG